MIEILIGFVGALAASTSVYFQTNDTSSRNSKACKSLAKLLVALRAIGETGHLIGIALDSREIKIGDSKMRTVAFDNLIQMLEVQNHNIREANKALLGVERILEIQTLVLSELYFHLRGKNHRIDILYDAAMIEKLKKDPYNGVEHWEVSKLQSNGESMRDILAEAMSSNITENISIGENIRETDENYQRLLDAIGPLEKLINENCSLGDLA